MVVLHVSPLCCHLQGKFLLPSERCSIKGEAVDRILGMLWRVVSSDVVHGAHHVTTHNTPIHNILSTAPQFSISQKALGTLPEEGNVMPKHVEATIHN